MSTPAPSRPVRTQVGPGFCGIVLLAIITLFVLKWAGVPGITWLIVFLPGLAAVGLTAVAGITLAIFTLLLLLIGVIVGAAKKKEARR